MLARVPIRLRLTIWYVLLLALILAAFAAGVYLLLRHNLNQNLNESIQNRASALLNVVQFEEDRPVLPGQGSFRDPDQEKYFARVFDASGSVTFDDTSFLGGVLIDSDAVNRALAGNSTTTRTEFIEDDDPIRVAILPITRNGAILGALEVGQSEEDVSETLSSLLLVLAIAYAVTLVVAGVGGVFLAGRALLPIDTITRAARQISGEDLSKRLDLAGC